MHLKNKVAIIHGGGGSIGGAVARVFAREGAQVHLTGRTASKLEAVAKDIREAGGRAEFAVLDAFDEAAVHRHADDVAQRTGGIDILLNAIGVPHVQGTPFLELTLAEFMHPIERYMMSHFITAQAATKHMAKRGSGVVLTLSTPGSRLSAPGFAGYGVTCGAVETFSRILAGELAPSGIRVVCLRPTVIPEAIPTSHAGQVFQHIADRMGIPLENMLAESARSSTLLGRFPRMAEVAEYAAFAASDRAGAMTGVIANLNCGSLVD